MQPCPLLISGGGIAGLTLAILLREKGWDPLVVEHEPSLRTTGYMMDFFGTGWDVAARMGLTDDLRAVRYPIERLTYVDRRGDTYIDMPIERLRRALDGRYVYLRRQDLERILADRAGALGVRIRYGRSIAVLSHRRDGIRVRFDDGGVDDYALVVGADGAHSNVRRLVFGNERQFARFLGLYVAAFPIDDHAYPIGRSFKLFEDTNRIAGFYPLDERRLDATYTFRYRETDVAAEDRLAFVRERFQGAGWVAEEALNNQADGDRLYFDSATQIYMPRWHRGHVVLIGDACGALTLFAGQGSHMAMAGAYVLATELVRRPGPEEAFAAYQATLKPQVDRIQRDAAQLAHIFVPTARSRRWLRRLAMRAVFSPVGLKLGMALFGARSVLAEYP